MDDKKIEDEIRRAADSYEIQTDSRTILEKFYRQREEKKQPKRRFSRLLKRFWAIPTAVLATSLVVALVLPSILRSSDEPDVVVINPQDGIRGGTRSQTAFQIFSGLNLLESYQVSASGLSRYKAATQSEFDAITDAFDRSYPTLLSLLETSIDIPNTIEAGRFRGQYGSYDYRMTIEMAGADLFFLNNVSFEGEEDETETNFTGEILVEGGDNYRVSIEKEEDLEDGELEVEMEIAKSEQVKIKISQEQEEGEKEYCYEIKDGGSTIYQEQIKFESDEEQPSSCSLEIMDLSGEYAFENIVRSGGMITAEYRLEDIEGSFILLSEDQARRYRDAENQLESVKKF